jgi:hypothetical protein
MTTTQRSNGDLSYGVRWQAKRDTALTGCAARCQPICLFEKRCRALLATAFHKKFLDGKAAEKSPISAETLLASMKNEP